MLMDVEYLIVDAGAAGCTLGWLLQRAKKSVLVLLLPYPLFSFLIVPNKSAGNLLELLVAEFVPLCLGKFQHFFGGLATPDSLHLLRGSSPQASCCAPLTIRF